MAVALALVCGYVLGSLPVGLVAGRLFVGVDVRDYGSGKTGFTNTLRVLGARRSLLVFAGDLGKGVAAALLPLAFTDDPWARALGGLAAVVGHVWPVFAGFRGGRGVLAGAGVLVALDPLAVLLVVPVAVIALAATRIMSVVSLSGGLAAAAVFVAFAAAGWHPWAYAAVALAGSGLIIVMHRENIHRLRAGLEPRIGLGGERRPAA